MLENDYYDDEALIQDDMDEEAYDIPPMYDDSYMEEDVDADMANGSEPLGVLQRDDFNVERKEEMQASSPQCTDDVGSDVPPMWISNTARVSNKTSALYEFERFNGKVKWRTDSKSPNHADTMTAISWKDKHVESSEEERNNDPVDGAKKSSHTSPEVQMLRFVNFRGCGNDYILNDTEKVAQRQHRRQRFSIKNDASCIPTLEEKSVAITLSNGKMFHIGRTSTATLCDPLKHNNSSNKDGLLLGIPFSELIRRSDNLERKDKSRRTTKQQDNTLSNANLLVARANDNDSRIEEKKDQDVYDSEQRREKDQNMRKQQMKLQQLWVDKHAPSHFSHLLSDDRTNREVLRALRAWDPYVFQRDPPLRPESYQKFLEEKRLSDKNYKPKDTNDDDVENQQKDIRPSERNRVILLSGPPGVGKTTLAHIIAKHAGYRPLEVNASDERTVSVLRERVINAMDSTTLTLTSKNHENNHMAGRPNCLILDEVDGADAKSAIASLVEIICADLPMKGKNKKPLLRRPIIFICNHKFAPALRPLLPYARQFDVHPPTSNRLVARLQAVLAAENMTAIAGSALLYQLVAATGGDIRSSLFTLQFASTCARSVAARKRAQELIVGFGTGDSQVVDISKALKSSLGDKGTGMKDERSDITGTLSAIFRKLKKKPFSKTNASSGEGMRDIDRVLSSVEVFGDNSKTLDCLFMNIMQVSYIDPTLDRCSAAHEWLSSADTFRSFKTSVALNNSAEHYSIQKCHIPSAAAAVHLLCRVETKPKLTFSTRPLTDSFYQLEANSGLVGKFIEGLSPKTRCGIHAGNATIDVIPFCLWLLSAGQGCCSLNRAVSSIEILNKNEKAAFDSHVATLRALGLSYMKSDDLQATVNGYNGEVRLEPEIDKLIRFEDFHIPDAFVRNKLPSVLKELLAHAASLEDMRERERELKTKTLSSTEPQPAAQKKLASKLQDRTCQKRVLDGCTVSTNSLPASNQSFLGIGAAKAKAAKTARKAAQVGFDRTKKVKLSNSGSEVPLNQVIRFNYQKGFTQAVRVPCCVVDLL